MTRLTHDSLDDPAQTVDAALDDFERAQKIKDRKQAQRDRIETAQNEEDLYDDDND
jgi:hypothetical protein